MFIFDHADVFCFTFRSQLRSWSSLSHSQNDCGPMGGKGSVHIGEKEVGFLGPKIPLLIQIIVPLPSLPLITAEDGGCHQLGKDTRTWAGATLMAEKACKRSHFWKPSPPFGFGSQNRIEYNRMAWWRVWRRVSFRFLGQVNFLVTLLVIRQGGRKPVCHTPPSPSVVVGAGGVSGLKTSH